MGASTETIRNISLPLPESNCCVLKDAFASPRQKWTELVRSRRCEQALTDENYLARKWGRWMRSYDTGRWTCSTAGYTVRRSHTRRSSHTPGSALHHTYTVHVTTLYFLIRCTSTQLTIFIPLTLDNRIFIHLYFFITYQKCSYGSLVTYVNRPTE